MLLTLRRVHRVVFLHISFCALIDFVHLGGLDI